MEEYGICKLLSYWNVFGCTCRSLGTHLALSNNDFVLGSLSTFLTLACGINAITYERKAKRLEAQLNKNFGVKVI